MTYGRPVAEDRINLDWTRAGIGIDNLDGLLPLERRVRARNLLAARWRLLGSSFPHARRPADKSPVGILCSIILG